MKIISLHAENVKRLRAVDIYPHGSVVQIRGRNAQGKSSVLDAIWMALGGAGTLPAVPVREGQDRAEVRLVLDDIVVKRTITAEGKTTLKVENREGAKLSSPQTLLDKLVAGLSFDPLAFTRMEKKERFETLRQLVGIDFSLLDAERAAKFDRRTDVGREARRLEGELSGFPLFEGAPAEPVSVVTLVEELTAARREVDASAQRGRDIARHQTEAAQRQREAEVLREQIASLTKRAEALESEANNKRATAEELQEEHALIPVPAQAELDAIRARIDSAEEINEKVRGNQRHAEIKAKVEAERAQYQKLSARIDAIDALKKKHLAEAKYPLEGLTLGEDGVYLDGLPFEQASSAQQLRASVAMGMALAPELRVLLVREGSFLDDESLRVMAEMADGEGFQIWIERVDSRREGPGILIEDGEVALVGSEAAE